MIMMIACVILNESRSGGSPTNFIETYDTRADRWIRVSEVDPTGG